jgi:hypothetical protein
VTFDPRAVPSSKNCTLAIGRLSVAVAEIVMVPDTVAPLAGEVIETDSGVVLVLLTVIDTAALVALFPELSVAIAVRLCFPFVSVVVFNDWV